MARDDLFAEEGQMPTMSFGDHLDELRSRLILALLGLVVGIVITLIPPLNLGQLVLTEMQEPAKVALAKYDAQRAQERAKKAQAAKEFLPPVVSRIDAADFAAAVSRIYPELKPADPETLKDLKIEIPIRPAKDAMILAVDDVEQKRGALITLSPLEPMSIFFFVCVVVGLVIASPWVFYQAWAFVAAGLYRHERLYVTKFLPMSIGLFLLGVMICFFGVLPLTLSFLIEFSVWIGSETTWRLEDWMSFATMLPLVFGLCFQTPLVMLFLERIGLMSANDFRKKRKMAIMVMLVVGAVLTPGQDPYSMVLLAAPMLLLYELGIILIGTRKTKAPAEATF